MRIWLVGRWARRIGPISVVCVPHPATHQPNPNEVPDAAVRLTHRFLNRFASRWSVFKQYFGSWGIIEQVWDALVCDVLMLSSIVWARLEVCFGSWPWLLLGGLFDDSVFEDFLDHKKTPTCCLDASFSEPFRARFGTLVLLKSQEALQLLRTLAHRICTTNMMTEALIAEVCSSPAQLFLHKPAPPPPADFAVRTRLVEA
jgi:hypothetical protein